MILPIMILKNVPRPLHWRSYVCIPSSLPKQSIEVQFCGKQLLRSGTSIAANFREAYRARSTAEFISKLEQCLQEADESQLWLELLKEGCNIENNKIDDLWQECDELIAIMVTWVKKSKWINPLS
jgi:four helix bundle protein